MSKMSDRVRQLVGLENILMKARRRHRECEREERRSDGTRAKRYAELIVRLTEEIHAADQSQLEHYLSKIRPLFLRAHDHDGLWASAKGCPMTSGAIYSQVCKRTEGAFGFPVNLHLFRDCAATMIAERDPRHVRVSRDLLGHSRLETTDRYYNHAQSHHAALAYQAGIAALRRRLTRGQR